MEQSPIPLTPEQQFEMYAKMAFANIKKNIVQDLINNRKESIIFKKFPKEKVITMLANPQKSEKELRKMSNYLFLVSSHYRRLITYYSNLPTFNYIITPTNFPKKINKKSYRDTYNKVVSQVEKYCLKDESPKILKSVFLEGIFYGLTYETTDSYYIKSFDSEYADISSIEDGTYVFSIDLNYFNTRLHLLEQYGEEIVNAYDEYRGNKDKGIKGDLKKRWYEPSNGICIKADSNTLISVPVFCSVFSAVLDLEDYKLLKKAKTEVDNYKVLAMQMETDENGIPEMEYEMAMKYYGQAANNIPAGIGLILTPFKINDFSFQKSAVAETDGVQQAIDGFWSDSGTSGMLMGSTKASSSSSLGLSIKPDEEISFSALYEIARYFNKIIKMMNLPYKFKIEFLEQSIFNKQEVQNQFHKAATYGVSGAKLLYASSLDMTPSDIIGLSYLENEILEVTEKMFKSPLISSNTLSPDSEEKNGRTPTDNPTDSTEVGRDNGANDEN